MGIRWEEFRSVIFFLILISLFLTALLPGEKALEEGQEAPLITGIEEGRGYVLVTWELPAGTNTMDLAGFRIYKGPAEGDLAALKLEGASKTSYNDTTVEDGTLYNYAVAALYGVDMEEALSLTFPAAPGGEPSAPNILGIRIDGQGLNVTWEPPTDDGGFPIKFYTIQRKDESGVFQNLGTKPGEATSYLDLSVLEGNSYTYRVIAVNDKGPSGSSNERIFDLPVSPEAPSSPIEVRATSGKIYIVVEWSPPLRIGSGDLLGYKIYRTKEGENVEKIATLSKDLFEYNDTSVEMFTNYTYSVVAFNSDLDSEPSTPLTVAILPEEESEPEDNGKDYGTRNAVLLGGAIAIIVIAGAIVFYLRMTRDIDDQELDTSQPENLRPKDQPLAEEDTDSEKT